MYLMLYVFYKFHAITENDGKFSLCFIIKQHNELWDIFWDLSLLFLPEDRVHNYNITIMTIITSWSVSINSWLYSFWHVTNLESKDITITLGCRSVWHMLIFKLFGKKLWCFSLNSQSVVQFMYLADDFMQRNLHCTEGKHFYQVMHVHRKLWLHGA